MITQVGKWGHSLALRIPTALAQTLAVTEGKSVKLTVENGNLVVSPVDVKIAYRLVDLLATMDESNTHEEVDYGKLRGREIF